MMKRQEGKKEKRAMAAAVVFGGMVVLAGCVRQTDVPIVSEKTESHQESLEEKETGEGQGSETGKPEGEEQEGQEKGLIREQAEVPERYRVSVKGEDVTVTADVEVGVPEVDRVCLKDVEYSPYTDQELSQISKVLGEELGLARWTGDVQNAMASGDPGNSEDNSEGNSVIYLSAADLAYSLDLRAGDGQTTPVVWLTATDVSDGIGGAGDPDDLSACPMTEAEMAQVQAVLENKAEQLLKKMGLEDFCLERARWRQLSVSENYSWTLSGQYGVRLYYGRKIGHMPLVNSGLGTGSLEPDSQYVEFLYREDGTLLTVKNIGREKITDSSEYADSLISFSSASGIFEQCMRTLKVDWDSEAKPAAEARLEPDLGPVLTEGPGDSGSGKKPHVYVTVTDVDLAYYLKYDGGNGDVPQTEGQKGKLAPVWVFYGTAERGYQNPDGTKAGILGEPLSGGTKMLLIAVGGEDGTVYGGISELAAR